MKNPTLFQISEIKISYWPGKMKRKDRPKIKSSDIAYNILHPNWDDIAYRESFGILLLDRANQVLGLRWISQGGQAGTVVDPVFRSIKGVNLFRIIIYSFFIFVILTAYLNRLRRCKLNTSF